MAWRAVAGLMLVSAVATAAPADPKLEMRLTRVYPADVVQLVADMRAQGFVLVRPAVESRIDIPRQRITPLTLRQQMLNRLDMKVVQRGTIETMLPACQRPTFQPLAFASDERATLNFVRLPAGAALHLVADIAKLKIRDGSRMPDADVLIRVEREKASDIATSIAAALDVELKVVGEYLEVHPRTPDSSCTAARFEQITSDAIPKRSKAESPETQFSQTECGRLTKFPSSKDISCHWYESFPLSRFGFRGFIALSDRGEVYAIVEPPHSPLSREVTGSRISEDFVAFSEVTRESAQLSRFEYRDGELVAVEVLRVPMDTGVPATDAEAPLPSRLPAKRFTTEYYPLEELRVEEIVSREGQKEVLLRNVHGVAMRARVGFRLGVNSGRITKIDDDGVTVVEILPDGHGGYRQKQARMLKGQWYEDPRVALVRALTVPINDSPAQRAFIAAALDGDVKRLAGLSGKGATIDARLAHEDRNALMSAVVRGHLPAVRWLLANGAKPDLLIGTLESTALQAAVIMESTAIANALLDAGADVNLADAKSRTPLLEAAGGGHAEMVDLLIRHRADPRLESDLGITPFTSAAANGHIGCVKRLLAAGVKLEEQDRSGYTMLSAAVTRGHVNLARFLLTQGADANVKMQEGQRLLDAAIEEGAGEEMIALLRAHGAKQSAGR